MIEKHTDTNDTMKIDGVGIPEGSQAPTLRVVPDPSQAEWLDRYGAVRSPLGVVLGVPLYEANEYTDLLLECLRTTHPNQTRQRLLAKAHKAQMRSYARQAQAQVTRDIAESLFVNPDRVRPQRSRRARPGDEDYEPDRTEWWQPENLPEDAPEWPADWDDDQACEQACDDEATLLPLGTRVETLYWIDPYPSYDETLDQPEVAIKAVWYLYCRERWDLLAYLGLDPEGDGDVLDACFPDDQALHVAAVGRGLRPGPVSPLGQDRLDVLYQECPRFFEAARRLLKAYRTRTYATYHERKAGERRWERYMARMHVRCLWT